MKTLFFSVLLAPAIATAQPVFRGGAAAVDITPPQLPVRVNGMFTERLAQQITDKLHARAIALDDGKMKMVLCVVDSCMVPRALLDQAKDIAAKETGIPVEHMMISATHTHSAASSMACLGSREDPAYVAFVVPKIAESIVAAVKALQPARVGWSSADDWEHTHNRRWIYREDKMPDDPFGNRNVRAMMHPGYESPNHIGPSGPVDPQLSVLAVQTRAGEPLALLANYSQHYFGSPLISADYYGAFCRAMAKRLGQPSSEGPFVAIMSQGTSGDLMWMDYGAPKKNLAMDAYSEAVAEHAMEAYGKIEWHDKAPLAMVERRLTLNFRVPDAERLAWARQRIAALQGKLPEARPDIYAQEAIYLHEMQKAELKLQAIRIGELGITTLPNEVFAITGLKLKAQSPFASHFNIELANGAVGYIPPPEQHVLGGYTTWPARTAGLEVQAEPRIVETLLGAMEEASGRKRREARAENGQYAQAVLEAKPAAYWRLDDSEGHTARSAVANGPTATIMDGVALYLPGAGSGTGCGAHEKLTPSAFSGPSQINRAVHVAGGQIESDVPGMAAEHSVVVWFWLGMASGASDRSGALLTWPGGEAVECRQDTQHIVRLAFRPSNGEPAISEAKLQADDWHQAVIVRADGRLRVLVDGEEKPLLDVKLKTKGGASPLVFGKGLQGKLDEAAVFTRALTAAESAAFWKASSIAEQRTREAADRERATKEAALRAQPPKFPADYSSAIAAMKPVVHLPLDGPPRGVTLEGSLSITPGTFAAFDNGRIRAHADKLGGSYSVSLWFRNETPNDASAVTAYLFSRGPDGDKQAPGDHLGIGGNYRKDLPGHLIVFNGNAINQVVAGGTVIPPGTWNHVVLVRDGKQVRLYLNGGTTPELDAPLEVSAPGVADFFLGARTDHLAPLHGHLAQFALFDRTLTSDEAKKLHTASGQPVGTPKATDLPPPSAPKLSSEPLSPDESLRKVHVDKGFSVELAAAEPQVLDPVAFDWDEHGRLWVVEMADYPLGMDGNGKAGGRVRILEDTDHDGRYDKAALFAEGLNFPTGILTWRDGCLVTAAPDVLFLRDKNGDGKEDERQVLFTGFMEGNQQLRVNGLRWGLDGWVYCANGGHHVNYGKDVAITSTLSGQQVALGSRDFRFKPDTGELDPLSGPSQFGRNRDAWGHWFGVQNSWPLWHYVLEDTALRRNPHVAPPSPKVLLTTGNPPVYPVAPQEKRYHSFDQAGRFTSACAATPYLDTLLFEETKEGHAFTCEPFHNVVQHFILEDDGITFKAHRAGSESQHDFFASEDRWCRPVMTRTGPDGALWVADMYRYMIEHPQWLPQNGKDELAPHYRVGDDKGRIYRVFPEGKRPAAPTSLDGRTTAQLVETLNSSNGWLRDKAHMMLVWRADKSAVPALEKLCSGGNALTHAHALSVLEALDALKADHLIAALKNKRAGVREHALRLVQDVVGGRSSPGSDELLVACAALVDDPEPRVRLQLALALGEWEDHRAGDALAKLAARDADNELMRAAVLSSATLHASALAEHLVEAPAAFDRFFEPLLQTALGAGQRGQLVVMLQHALSDPAGGQELPVIRRLGVVLSALKQSGVAVEKLPAGERREDGGRLTERIARLLHLAEQWFADEGKPLEARLACAGALLANDKGGGAVVEKLTDMLQPGSPPEAQKQVVTLIASAAPPKADSLLLKAWPSLSPEVRFAVLDALMGRETWALALLQHVKGGDVAPAAFDAQRQARLLKHPLPKVRKLAEEVFAGSATPSRAKVLENFKPALAMKGDPVQGKVVFATVCVACHELGGVGRPVGPDLRSVVQHPDEKLLTSILDPSANIEPGFTAYHCEMKSGEQLYGIITGETGGSLSVKLADGTTRALLRQDIARLESTKASLMPDGLEAVLTQKSLADLIAFLHEPK